MDGSANRTLSHELVAACGSRQKRLVAALTAAGVDALLVSCEKDIHYLTGFIGHDSFALVLPAATIIISDPRYDEFLNPWRSVTGVEVVMGKRHRLPDTVKQLCESRSIRRLGIQAEHTTIAGRARLEQTIGESLLVNTQGLVSTLRRCKDALEVATIERALGIQQDALHAALDQFSIGMSELEFSARLEYEMKMRGGHGAGFTPIIGAGSNSSIIHHATSSTPIRSGVLLVDWGTMVDGYNGDLTRTFAVGDASDLPAKVREIHPIVLEAQLAAIASIAPGKICADIDAVARKIITMAGYGAQFGHGLGHGLGMDVHEPPFFNDLETNTKLEPGMIMTVEPGIYLPGIGGVRIEDDVLVTEAGCRVLSSFPKSSAPQVITTTDTTTSKVQASKVQSREVVRQV